jgi:hypothetical protein
MVNYDQEDREKQMKKRGHIRKNGEKVQVDV